MKKYILLIGLLLKLQDIEAQSNANVIISGKLTDVYLPVSLKITDNYFLFEDETSYIAKINPDSKFVIKFYINEPKSAFLINLPIFCEPGDSIFVAISEKGYAPRMVFERKKVANYTEEPGVSHV